MLHTEGGKREERTTVEEIWDSNKLVLLPALRRETEGKKNNIHTHRRRGFVYREERERDGDIEREGDAKIRGK